MRSFYINISDIEIQMYSLNIKMKLFLKIIKSEFLCALLTALLAVIQWHMESNK